MKPKISNLVLAIALALTGCNSQLFTAHPINTQHTIQNPPVLQAETKVEQPATIATDHKIGFAIDTQNLEAISLNSSKYKTLGVSNTASLQLSGVSDTDNDGKIDTFYYLLTTPAGTKSIAQALPPEAIAQYQNIKWQDELSKVGDIDETTRNKINYSLTSQADKSKAALIQAGYKVQSTPCGTNFWCVLMTAGWGGFNALTGCWPLIEFFPAFTWCMIADLGLSVGSSIVGCITWCN